ncbi:MAG TPA: serine/threonine-protein kinase, partial [Ktedonobacteraceae bacterium]|nr:serine/threonine-protein kinase [Ktedonobacteraceae bacterium]
SPGLPNSGNMQVSRSQTSQGPVSQVFNRSVIPFPSVSMKSGNKQAEKITLDGLSIGRYQLKSIIGGNPIGDVYLTYDRLREQDIALKTIQTNMIPYHLMEGLEDVYNLFQQEMDLLQQVEHPHISRVMSIGKSYISGFPFIYKTMPYYLEGSLARWLNQFPSKTFPSADVARVILQLADAIQFLHNRGLLYQNFKQSNILVVNETHSMHDLHVVLSDLPFVQDMINLPKTSESYRYIAPEQWDGEVFTSSDQYGLAVVAYELLTGRAPFQGNADSIMRRMHLTMPAPPPSSFNPGIYPFIDKVILRALSKRAEERYESISAFAAALERASN